jgi:hypothetical protein
MLLASQLSRHGVLAVLQRACAAGRVPVRADQTTASGSYYMDATQVLTLPGACALAQGSVKCMANKKGRYHALMTSDHATQHPSIIFFCTEMHAEGDFPDGSENYQMGCVLGILLQTIHDT